MTPPDQSVIRLQLDLALNPPVTPIDLNTGKTPQAWSGADLAVEIGIFFREAAVDLSNLDFLEVDVFPTAIFNQLPGSNWTYNPYSVSPYPNLPPAPIIFTTIPADEITDKVGVEEWRDGNVQQARVLFSFVQMAQLELNGKAFADFWLAVQGLTSDGRKIVYGAAPFRVFDSGSRAIYLPNAAAPLLVPEATIFYVAPNTQIPFSIPITVEGQIVVDGGILVQT